MTQDMKSGWHGYGLDRYAQKLVLKAKKRDEDSLNQAHKMRQTVAYGLERFWGEQFRLQKSDPQKAKYWACTWKALTKILKPTGIILPCEDIKIKKNDDEVIENIQEISGQLWGEKPVEGQTEPLSKTDRRVALAVLTQLCDCLVWWTQRYKGGSAE